MMEQPLTPVRRMQHVCLRVRDVQRSLCFYCQVLGLQEKQTGDWARTGHVRVLCDLESGTSMELLLTQGLPPGEYLVGLDHLAFEASSVAGVNAVYQRAAQASFQATQPRIYNGSWKCFLFDPDGYKLEVSAQADESSNTGQAM
jgi:lactoylglutathione lyase